MIEEEELLAKLIILNGYATGPKRSTYHTTHYETIVGVGPDNVASIRFDEETLQLLKTKYNVE